MSSSAPSRFSSGERTTATPDHDSLGDNAAFRLVAVGALLMSVAFMYSCDTVARISFPSRALSQTHTAGFTLPANACGNPGEAGAVNLRFAFVDSDNAPIRPPGKGGAPLESGSVDLTTEDIDIGNAGVFEYPDLQCTSGSATSMQGQQVADASGDVFGADTMTDTGTADTGGNGGNGGNGNVDPSSALYRQNFSGNCVGQDYSCQTPSAIREQAGDEANRCYNPQEIPTRFSNQEVEFVSDVQQDQLFGVLVENAASIRGFTPTSITDFSTYDPWEDDENDTGTRMTNETTPTADVPIDASATDADGERYGAISTMASNWENARQAAAADGRETRFGLWAIEGSPVPTSYVNDSNVTSSETYWTGDIDTADAAVSEWTSTSTNTGAQIWSNLNHTIENRFTDANCPNEENCEKTLVLVVDGTSDVPLADLRPNNEGNVPTFDELRQKLVDAGIRLYIVHFDPGFDDSVVPNGENHLTLDNPDYYRPQAECSSDSDCFHHQTCRKVDGYSNESGEQPITVPENPQAEYCVPVRGDDGRVGAIGQYSRLACATGGSYIYRKDNIPLEVASGWLPYTMDGLWEVRVPIDALASESYIEGQPIKLRGEVTYTINGTSTTSNLSQLGENFGPFPANDTRSVIMSTESE